MISNNIQILGGIGWSLISPTDSNKWNQDCARLLAKITFWHRYCRVLLKALWSCWWWGGMSLSDEMKRSPSENWLFFLFYFFFFFAISPRFQSPSPTSLLLPKKNCQSCNSVYASRVQLPFSSSASPLQMFQWRCSLMETPFPSLSLSVPLEERHLLHYFFPSDDTCGRIREQDRGVGGPLWIHRLIYCFCSCWTW